MLPCRLLRRRFQTYLLALLLTPRSLNLLLLQLLLLLLIVIAYLRLES